MIVIALCWDSFENLWEQDSRLVEGSSASWKWGYNHIDTYKNFVNAYDRIAPHMS